MSCNLPHRVADLKSQGEESYWTPGPSQPNPNPRSESSWMWAKPPPSLRTSRYARLSIPIYGSRAAFEFDPESYHFEEAFGNQEEQLGPICENNDPKHFDAIVFRLIAGSPDRVGLYTTEAHADFSPKPLELSTVIAFLISPHVKVNALRKTIDRFLITYTDESIFLEEEATKKITPGLGTTVSKIQPSSWAKSLKGLQLADNLLSGFGKANISTSIIFKPLHEMLFPVLQSGKVVILDLVLEELKDKEPDLYKQLKTTVPKDRKLSYLNYLETTQKLIQKYYDGKGKSHKLKADPHIIACAKTEKLKLVTEELNSDITKIPYVCGKEKVTCINFLDLLREEGIILS